MAIKRKCVARRAEGAAVQKEIDVAEDAEEASVDGSEMDAQEEVDESQKQAEEEQARKKELKALPINDLKELVEKLGLERAKKEDMVQSVLDHEAEVRRQKEASEARMRSVVVEKTQELKAAPVDTLKKQCAAQGIQVRSKQEMVERLLAQWQMEDGITKALVKIDRDAREGELTGMSKAALSKYCSEVGVDPLVKDVMVDRIARQEQELGKFDAPSSTKRAETTKASDKKASLVDQLLAEEAARAEEKKEEEQRKALEAVATKKKNELNSLTVVQLRKQLASKKLDAVGTKDQLIESLLNHASQEEALAAKKKDLIALGKDGLKLQIMQKGLETGSIRDMVDSLIAYERKIEEEAREYEGRVMEMLKKKKEELDAMSGSALKELCATKGLVVGATENRVQRLLQAAKESGEIEAAISAAAFEARRCELRSLETAALGKICKDLKVDPFVKEVLVERLLAHEAKHGKTEGEEPPAKKMRKK